MKLLRGIGADSRAVVFLADADSPLSKQLEAWAGDPVGAPSPGTIAREIADVRLAFDPIDDGAELLLQQDPTPPEPADVPESVRLFNKALIERKPRHFIMKSEDGDDDDQGLSTMIVMEPNDGADGADLNPDTQGDVFSKQDVEDACYYWLENGGQVDFMHNFEPLERNVVKVAASDVTRGPVTLGEGEEAYECAVGTWLVTLRWDTDSVYWKGLKEGAFKAVSPGGLAQRVPLEEGAADGS